MTPTQSFKYIGVGVYTLSDAERLTKIPAARIRRWLEGYSYRYRGELRRTGPTIRSDLGRDAGELALTFADLMEVRFLDAFREVGVSWRHIKIAARRAAGIVKSSHPFSTKTFKTDGDTILAEIANPDHGAQLIDLVRNQWEIRTVVLPFLFAGVEYDEGDEPCLWRPLKDVPVVLDPLRSFGSPIVEEGSIQTRVLYNAVRAEGSQRGAAWMFNISLRAVRAAVKFEAAFAA